MPSCAQVYDEHYFRVVDASVVRCWRCASSSCLGGFLARAVCGPSAAAELDNYDREALLSARMPVFVVEPAVERNCVNGIIIVNVV